VLSIAAVPLVERILVPLYANSFTATL